MRPGELARAKAALRHAAKGHRELATHHRAEHDRLATDEDSHPLAGEGAEHSHERMAQTHEQAAGELEAKAEALK